MYVWSLGDIRHPPLPLFALNSISQWTRSTDQLAREPRGHFCPYHSGLEWQSRAVVSCCLHGYRGFKLSSSCLISKCFTPCQFLGPLSYCSFVNSFFATLGIKTRALSILSDCTCSEWRHSFPTPNKTASTPPPHCKRTLPFGNAGATTALKGLLNFPAKTDIRYGWMSSLLLYGNKSTEKPHSSPQTAELVVTIRTLNQVRWPLLLQTLPSLLSQVNGLALEVSELSSCLNWSVAVTEVRGCNPDGQTDADEAYRFNSF